MEKLGTLQIEQTADVLIGLALGIERSLADDGKISFSEAVSLAVGTAPGVYTVARNAKQLKEELKDFSPEEKAQLLEKVAVKFDLDNDRTEELIEAGMSLAAELSNFVGVIKGKTYPE